MHSRFSSARKWTGSSGGIALGSMGLLLATALAASAGAQQSIIPPGYPPEAAELAGASRSEMRDAVERFTTDAQVLARRFAVPYSPARESAFGAFYASWEKRLAATPFDDLDYEGKVDYILLANRIRHDAQELRRDAKVHAEVAPLIGFADTIMQLDESRRRFVSIDGAEAARTLATLAANADSASARMRALAKAGRAGSAAQADGAKGVAPAGARSGGSDSAGELPTRIVAYRAAEILTSLQRTLSDWFRYYDDYDPMFTWWARNPYAAADSSITAYIRVLREDVVGVRKGEDEPIVGLPIGRDAIMEDLVFEMIPYTPEELIDIARKDLAWSQSEMKKAARELGYGDDWRAALEHVKNTYVPPGKQRDLVRDLEREAVDYITSNDLVTVPPLAQDVWRMEMLSPERQKVAPFFLGGETMLVAYPTESMSEADKMMSLRGNNPHFSRATVFHELIPGHHLQGFMNQRYFPYRRAFRTPFWHEGNAFYWETLLWDKGFTSKPEDRIGALFWRSHRAARIIFSLSFHLGLMTPQECIDFLVDSIGHERANATAEVRRSFNGSYSPLYQVAYMMGGLQFRALHHELVDAGRMTDLEFHDAILHGGPMPVEMVRARLTHQSLTRDYRPHWKYREDIPPSVSR